jgi:hypothetical protein
MCPPLLTHTLPLPLTHSPFAHRATLRVAAVECEALWQSRKPCPDDVEGLDLASLNQLHSFKKVTINAINLLECDYR